MPENMTVNYAGMSPGKGPECAGGSGGDMVAPRRGGRVKAMVKGKSFLPGYFDAMKSFSQIKILIAGGILGPLPEPLFD